MPDCHPIDYWLLRRLVPHYHAPHGYDLGAAQERNLMEMSLCTDPILDRWGINTLLRKAHFLGQSAEETRDFTAFYESNPDGTPIDGSDYEGKRGLGNTEPGDGARYIGRGAIQITGRYNYRQAEMDVDTFLNAWNAAHGGPPSRDGAHDRQGVDYLEHPELIGDFPGAIEAACAFWIRHGLNALADRDNVNAITHIINRANLYADKRMHYVEKAKRLLHQPSDMAP